jgi:cytochrome P450
MWLLSRYQDVAATLRDARRFTKVGHVTQRIDELSPDIRARVGGLYRNFSVGMAVTDPPAHTRIRALVSKTFTPRTVAEMRERIQAIADGLIDDLVGRDKFDLVREFAFPLPAMVVFEMLGFPTEARDQYKAWSDEIVAFHGTGRVDPDVAQRSDRALGEARAWILEQASERRDHPRDDLLTALVAAEERGDTLSADELVATVVTLGTAGHETTTGLLANGILALSRKPDQRETLRERPELVSGAIEEMLRYDPPFHRTWRVTTEPVTAGGVAIPEGAIVSQLLGAANRDPAAFADPETFNVARPEARHAAFGVGPHFCLGAPLARLEAQIAIPALLDRLGDLDVDETTLEWMPNNTFHAPTTMTVHVQSAR